MWQTPSREDNISAASQKIPCIFCNLNVHVFVHTHTHTHTHIYIYTYIREYYQNVHTSVLNLVYIHNELLHVSANRVTTFTEVKYKGRIIEDCKMTLQKYRQQSSDTNSHSSKPCNIHVSVISPLVFLILSQINPLYFLQFYIFTDNFNIIIPTTPLSFKRLHFFRLHRQPLKVLHRFLFSPTHVLCPAHLIIPLFYHPNTKHLVSCTNHAALYNAVCDILL
jgi:hypothetical protein